MRGLRGCFKRRRIRGQRLGLPAAQQAPKGYRRRDHGTPVKPRAARKYAVGPIAGHAADNPNTHSDPGLRSTIISSNGETELMKNYRHILCGTDFSPASDDACIPAMELARGSGAKLTLLHVIDHFP